MVIVGEAFHIYDFCVEIHSRNEGDAGNTLESFYKRSNVRVLSFFAKLFENIFIVFTDFFELENQRLERKIAGRSFHLQLLKPKNKVERPSSVAGELQRNLYSLTIEKPFDSVFDSGLRLNNTVAKPHESPEFFVEGIGDIDAVQGFVFMFTGKFA